MKTCFSLRSIDRANILAALRFDSDRHRSPWVPPLSHSICYAYTSYANRKWVPYLIYRDDILIGSVVLSLGIDNQEVANISGFHISELLQGKGYGDASLSLILSEIKTEYPQVRRLTLLVTPDNTRAVNLYRKHQFLASEELFDGEQLYSREI